jgi:DNA-binding transcriptional ArsR family regulator
MTTEMRSKPCCDAGAAEPRVVVLDDTALEGLASRLKALADPTRLRLLDLLAQQPEPLCVCEITPRFTQHQPTISHHLRLLREAGLVGTEKRGVWSYFWATDVGRRCLVQAQTLS